MSRIHLIHWQKTEGEKKAAFLRDSGHEVDCALPESAQFFKSLRTLPPDLLVIDLSRLPSQGRDFVINMRSQKSSQNIPVIFVEGDPQKTAKIRELIPDAIYTNWELIAEAIEHIRIKPPETQKQNSVFAAYADTPLQKKLTIQADMQICLLYAPPEFIPNLGTLPENLLFHKELWEDCQLIIWFVLNEKELKEMLPDVCKKCKESGARVWICWQKQGKAAQGKVTQNLVREYGLSAGLVDYKICSIDATWSGLLFRWRGF